MKCFSELYTGDIKTEFPEGNDARKIKYPDSYIDLAVTSPPYANMGINAQEYGSYDLYFVPTDSYRPSRGNLQLNLAVVKSA